MQKDSNINFFTVITTIQEPTDCVETNIEETRKYNGELIVIGDKKGPQKYDSDNTHFFNLESQKSEFKEFSELTPLNHYARKNIGYLIAIKKNANIIFDTDDDNHLFGNHNLTENKIKASRIENEGWVNVYKYFTKEKIWPRGLPLNFIDSDINPSKPNLESSSIVCYLADGSPDTDAIWRLVMDKEIIFEQNKSFILSKNTWCPFNSQATIWLPKAFPLLYLPSYCSFRMTDIWRSFIAQKCLWALGEELIFCSPKIFQKRNYHVLMKDFEDEVPGYLRNEEMIEILNSINLNRNTTTLENLFLCYEKLVEKDFFTKKELELVQQWIKQVNVLLKKHIQ